MHLPGQGAHRRVEAALRRRVRGEPGVAALGADRGDHDDPAPAVASDHRPQDGAGEHQRGSQVGLDDPGDVGRGRLHVHRVLADRRVVDHAVDPAELRGRVLDEGAHRLGVGDVEWDDMGAVGELVGEGLQLRGDRPGEGGDLRTGVEDHPDQGQAQAAGPAGDQHDLGGRDGAGGVGSIRHRTSGSP
ncbi:hypothetical protein SDC9_121689 [bioreactor metagenome]|uniref:Uncharacterized protein n=1 Tax=bioreactor metagenome TaxID=1076179 RepID=A0A645CCP7_9ZZZZ